MKEDLYIINYRNSYLSPICVTQEDNRKLKILITKHKLTIIYFIISITCPYLWIYAGIFLILIIFISVLIGIFKEEHPLSIKKDPISLFLSKILLINLEILSINKENKTITLLLYKDFPNKDTTLINLPLEFVTKIIIAKELITKEIEKLSEPLTHSICLPPPYYDYNYNSSTNEIYYYSKFNKVIYYLF
jgi:hypothetical protein